LGGVVLVLLVAMLFPGPRTKRMHAAPIAGAGFVYVAAKLAEALDDRIYGLGGLISGHSIKHLLVAVVGFQLLGVWRASRGGEPMSNHAAAR
jgi:hypothetical protein